MVAIVGRANVGKSSLFNALIGQRRAIVADEPGTTRDSVAAKASVFVPPSRASRSDAAQGSSEARAKRTKGTVSERRSVTGAALRREPAGATGFAGGQGQAARGYWKDFWLVDTAGLKSAADEFELTIQEQIAQASEEAAVIVVVVEAPAAISDEDRRVAKLALKTAKPVILAINKLDKAGRADLSGWQRLGIKNMNPVSSTQKRGLDELLERVAADLPKARIKEAADRLKIALVGRPNVGKSSLFNSLIAKQKSIVAPVAGTTRDVNHEVIRFEGREIELLDTAGIRRSGKIERGVEQFSVFRALAAIEEADIALLVMEAGELNVQLDQKIAGLVKEAGKGLILTVSKWDSIEKEAAAQDYAATGIAKHFAFVPWAPLVFTSTVSGQNVTKLFDLALQVAAARDEKFRTPALNRWLRETVYTHPPAGLKNRQPKLNYIIQEEDQPLPSFKIFGSQTKFLHWSYKRYLERKFREQWPLPGTPLKFWLIEKAKPVRE